MILPRSHLMSAGLVVLIAAAGLPDCKLGRIGISYYRADPGYPESTYSRDEHRQWESLLTEKEDEEDGPVGRGHTGPDGSRVD